MPTTDEPPVEIHPPRRSAQKPLCVKFLNQFLFQDAFLEIYPRNNVARWDFNPEIGSGVHPDVHYGLVLRVPCANNLTRAEIEEFTGKVRPFVQRVVDGNSEEWDGLNWVGHLSTDGLAAFRSLIQVLRPYPDDEA
jgi:hypothetical protein